MCGHEPKRELCSALSWFLELWATALPCYLAPHEAPLLPEQGLRVAEDRPSSYLSGPL